MGFLDSLGSALGNAAGQMKEQGQQMMQFKGQYQNWDSRSLRAEGKKWASKGGTEARLRVAAIKSILRDRGEIE